MVTDNNPSDFNIPGVDSAAGGNVVQVDDNAQAFSQGKQTAPAAGVLMADTGELEAGNYKFLVYCSATAAASFSLSHRNATNSGDLAGWPFDYQLGGQGTASYLALQRKVNSRERFRVTMDAALAAGTATVQIQAARKL